MRLLAQSDGLAVVHAKKPPVASYRFLYDAVGRDYDWTSRKKLSDAELTALSGGAVPESTRPNGLCYGSTRGGPIISGPCRTGNVGTRPRSARRSRQMVPSELPAAR